MSGETVGKLTTRALDGPQSALSLDHEAAPQTCQSYKIKCKFSLGMSFLFTVLVCGG